MSLLNKLFKKGKEIQIKYYMEDDSDNKIKCFNCDSLVDKNAKYCWKCGNLMCSNNEEKIEVATEIPREKSKYQYPDLKLIKDETFRIAIENIPDSGILNIHLEKMIIIIGYIMI